MQRGIIYLILNKQTDEKYISSTELSINKEWAYQIERSKRMSKEPLHEAFRRDGIHNFMIRQLDEYDENTLDKKLSYWINKFKPEYNVVDISEIPQNTPINIEIKEKKKNNPHLIPFNEKTRSTGKHSGLRIKGKNLETGKVYEWESAREAAKEVTGDPKKNSNILSAARKGYKCYGYKWQIMEEKKKIKPVFGVNKKTEQIEVRYESIAAAVRAFGDSNNVAIIRSLRNPGRYSWRGYYWFYQ